MPQPPHTLSRRRLLTKAAAVACSLPAVSSLLAACMGDNGDPTVADQAEMTTVSLDSTPHPVSSPTVTQAQHPRASASQPPAATMTPISAATSTPAPTPTQLTPAPTLIPADPDLLAGLRTMAIPFDTAEPESGFADLEPFRAIASDARIVALGEATHGTSEFFTMKHRLIELLVTELGFTTVAIEAPWPATKVINHYVQTGEGTRSQLLRALSFWIWQTQEVLDLIEWIRTYNARPDVAPVGFQAFDMQVSLDDTAVQQVLAFVDEVDPAGVGRFETYYAALPHRWPMTPADADVSGAQAAFDDLLEHREAYVTIPSSEPYDDILQTARMIVQFEQVLAADASSAAGFELRDQSMAENVTWLLDRGGPASKIILWAHNTHVAATTLPLPDGTLLRGMGSHLRERYGDALLVVGFDVFSGTFTARGADPSRTPSADIAWTHAIPHPLPESTEYTFAQLGLPRFMLDLRSAEESTAAGAWLVEARPMWAIGAVFDPTIVEDLRVVASLVHQFDVLLYFHDTSASQPLV